jgi:4'-phosphopantetheinyl transferase
MPGKGREQSAMRPAIAAHEVHVWLADCDAIDDEPMWDLLDAYEVNRATRFREPGDSKRYVVSHGVLRSILSKYLDIMPESIKYERGPYGKPGIAGGSWLRFNMSHSNGMAAYAIASKGDVGVDLEYIHDVPYIELTRSIFSTNEDAYLRSVRVEERLNVFFMLWTRKEAYIKAIGEGFYTKLNEIDVSFHNEMQRLYVGGSTWSIVDIITPDKYKGAVVIQGNVQDIKTFRWQ